MSLLDSTPEPIKSLDRYLGAFWGKSPFPYAPDVLDHNTERGLFSVQDIIENPYIEEPNSEGLIALISENQGVWHFSYNQEQQLLFEGDWIWGNIDSSFSPVPFPAKIQDVICFTLLGNFFAYMDNGTWQDVSVGPDDKWPDDINVKIWHHPAWDYHKGFWTNKDGTALLYDRQGIIRKV